MTGGVAIIGVDDRIDEHCHAQPWRIVLLIPSRPDDTRRYLMRLPDDRRYLSPPRDPIHGDLMVIDGRVSRQMQRLVEDLRGLGIERVHLDLLQYEGVVGRTLIWNGIEPHPHKVEDEGTLLDHHSIGGRAGHQISVIIDKLRSEP